MPDFEEVFRRIVKYAGEEFHTKTGDDFTYLADSNAIYPSRGGRRVSKNEIKKAYELVPFSGPSIINRIVQGPAYVWAILHDKRISQGQW